MKKYFIRAAGFGGQGIMLFGQMLAQAAANEGLNSLWFPSYGPETRGGTANCGVIISDERIDAPIFKYPTHLVAFNGASLDKFNHFIKEGSIVLCNSSVIDMNKVSSEGKVIAIPASDIANELGMAQVTNMVMIGAFLEVTNIFSDEVMLKVLKDVLGERKAKFVTINTQAIAAGRLAAKKAIGR